MPRRSNSAKATGRARIFHAQTTDKLLLAADDGRFYTLGGDKLPGGRGFGEPVRLLIDLPAEVEIVALMVDRPETQLLVAATDGRGFVTSGEATLAETRKGKQWSTCGQAPRSRSCAGSATAPTTSRSSARTARCWSSRLAELPELARGQGVTLQRYRDGGLADATTFKLAEGLSWALGGESGRVRTESDLTPGGPPAAPPGACRRMGFPRNNRFELQVRRSFEENWPRKLAPEEPTTYCCN